MVVNPKLKSLPQAEKLSNVLYEIRGPVAKKALELKNQGHEILNLNIGNPGAFNFLAPEKITQAIIESLPTSQGYSESQGIVSAREAILARYSTVPKFPQFNINDIYLGNGVSELITIIMQALLNNGDEVMIPSPDYPLWTAMTSLAGGKAVHYVCDENNNWQPDIIDIEKKITPKTKAIVIINPNNPTGAVYSNEILTKITELARKYSLLILADEIYDQIIYDNITHTSIAALAPDLLCITLNGLSKTYQTAGYRSGWLIITGPKKHANGFLHGIELLAATRLCANVPGQHAITAALSDTQSIEKLVKPGGRFYEQRNIAWEALTKIPGVSCVKPQGALYVFPKLDLNYYEIYDDEKFVLDLLVKEKILLVQGTGFNWPKPDHLRIVTLPQTQILQQAIDRIGNFLSNYKQTKIKS